MKKTFGILAIIFGSVFLVVGLAVGLPFSIIGGVFKGNAADNEARFEKFKKNAEHTKGVVLSSSSGTDISFEDEYGDEYILHFNMSSSSIRTGSKYTVYYDEKNPTKAMVEEIDVEFNRTFGNIFFIIGMILVCLFGVIGLLVLIMGIVLTKKAKKEAQAMPYGAGVSPEFINSMSGMYNNAGQSSQGVPINVITPGQDDSGMFK